MKLTKRSIESLKPARSGDLFVWDDEVAGFGLRLKPSGIRSFIVQYRNSSGQSRRKTLGKFGVLTADEARKLAKADLAEVAKGADPVERRLEERRAMTVRELCSSYLTAADKGLIIGKRGRPKRPSTLYVDRGRIERHILPLLGNRRVRDLEAPDIIRFMREIASGKTAVDVKTGFRGRAIVEGGQGTATRTVGLLGGIISYAVSEGIVSNNVVRGVRRPAGNRREIRLTSNQYRTLGSALGSAGEIRNPVAIDAIWLLALTGCRRGEIENLRWEEVDLPGRCLRLDDTKEGKSLRPLGEEAIVRLRKRPKESQYVFPGANLDGPFRGLPRVWSRIMNTVDLPGLTPHGRRHAFASVASDLGYAEPTIAAMLGHSTRSVTGRYIHHLDGALIAAADMVSRRIAAMMTGATAEILPFRADASA